jgi:hypothetical protein
MGSSVSLQNSIREEAIPAKEPTKSSSAERIRELSPIPRRKEDGLASPLVGDVLQDLARNLSPVRQ